MMRYLCTSSKAVEYIGAVHFDMTDLCNTALVPAIPRIVDLCIKYGEFFSSVTRAERHRSWK